MPRAPNCASPMAMAVGGRTTASPAGTYRRNDKGCACVHWVSKSSAVLAWAKSEDNKKHALDTINEASIAVRRGQGDARSGLYNQATHDISVGKQERAGAAHTLCFFMVMGVMVFTGATAATGSGSGTCDTTGSATTMSATGSGSVAIHANNIS